MAEKPSKEKTVANLYGEFYKYDQKGDYERALKSVNKIFQLVPDDVTAFQCKIVCLIYLNKFEEALQQLNKHAKLPIDMSFERAYCLYRTNNPAAALKVLDDVSNPSSRIQELKAQILYRLERFPEAMTVYDGIFRSNPGDDYEEERQTNLGAVASFLTADEIGNYKSQLKEDTYEMCYNKALLYAEWESFPEAEKMLKKAEKLLKEAFEEDGASEEETEAELAHIRILQAYCCQMQGRVKEAHQMYLSTLKLKLDDPSLMAVASNNVVVINKDQNVFDSKKKMKVATHDALVHKLPARHRKFIALNNAIFNYYTNQYENSNRICNLIEKEWPEHNVHTKILSALNAVKLNTKKDPIDMLLQAEGETQEDSLFIKLTCVQLLLMQGEKVKACNVLANLGDYRYKPGIVGALITLYLNQGKEDVALKIYEESIEWYKSSEKSDMDLTSLFKQAADFHIRNGRPHVAAKSLEQLITKNPVDMKTSAQLVVAYSQFDENKAIEMGSKLGHISELEGVDLDNVESSSWLTKKTVGNTPKDLSPGGSSDAIKRKKKKNRKRKGKLPKDYDASATPDPERWLPKYERSGFRKKRDRRMKDIIKGSQGTATGQSDQYDFSKVVHEQEDSPTGIDPSPMQRNTRQKKGGNQKKKNKRR